MRPCSSCVGVKRTGKLWRLWHDCWGALQAAPTQAMDIYILQAMPVQQTTVQPNCPVQLICLCRECSLAADRRPWHQFSSRLLKDSELFTFTLTKLQVCNRWMITIVHICSIHKHCLACVHSSKSSQCVSSLFKRRILFNKSISQRPRSSSTNPATITMPMSPTLQVPADHSDDVGLWRSPASFPAQHEAAHQVQQPYPQRPRCRIRLGAGVGSCT